MLSRRLRSVGRDSFRLAHVPTGNLFDAEQVQPSQGKLGESLLIRLQEPGQELGREPCGWENGIADCWPRFRRNERRPRLFYLNDRQGGRSPADDEIVGRSWTG